MARPIVLGNGEMHVGLNMYGMVHDFYYPYVGLENHSAGPNLRHHVGVWIDGRISWLDSDGEWEFAFRYPHMALIGHTIAKNTSLGIVLEIDDCVDSEDNVFLRNIHVVNLRPEKRSIRLFLHQAFAIGDSRSNTDTAQYLPDSNAVLHYRGRRAFVVSGDHVGDPFDQYSIGLFGIEGRQGTYKDAEDGELSMSSVEHGRVDSTIRFMFDIEPNSSTRVHYWIAAGKSIREALKVHKQVQEDGLLSHILRTADWWHKWLEPTLNLIPKISPEYRNHFLHSVMIIKSHIDKRGAVIASTDTTALNYDRDAYVYCWPRDAAFVLWPLIKIGYREEAKNFFEFAKRGLHGSGYLVHKYQADGAIGSSWHSYIQNDRIAIPIQEDETALTLIILGEFLESETDESVVGQYYEDLAKPMAEFMAGYIDSNGLPKPSYDLWEQVFTTSTYTTSTVYAALIAASELAERLHDSENSIKWRSIAEDMRAAAAKHLFNPDRKFFYKSLYEKDGQTVKDEGIDCSSLFGAYMFGLFDKDKEIAESVITLQQVFGFSKDQPGLPRYEGDDYRRSSNEITGNYWFITSLWLAQYLIKEKDQDTAKSIIDWVLSKALDTTVLGEQFDPVQNYMVSPAPLAWTHAEFLATILDILKHKDSA